MKYRNISFFGERDEGIINLMDSVHRYADGISKFSSVYEVWGIFVLCDDVAFDYIFIQTPHYTQLEFISEWNEKNLGSLHYSDYSNEQLYTRKYPIQTLMNFQDMLEDIDIDAEIYFYSKGERNEDCDPKLNLFSLFEAIETPDLHLINIENMDQEYLAEKYLEYGKGIIDFNEYIKGKNNE